MVEQNSFIVYPELFSPKAYLSRPGCNSTLPQLSPDNTQVNVANIFLTAVKFKSHNLSLNKQKKYSQSLCEILSSHYLSETGLQIIKIGRGFKQHV